ncbi:hypothetical protein Pelo_12768 [Pelomyxa schiedti]|nr:hypothetical protein Pelo_12768 [Pelomyxa schiedti]
MNLVQKKRQNSFLALEDLLDCPLPTQIASESSESSTAVCGTCCEAFPALAEVVRGSCTKIKTLCDTSECAGELYYRLSDELVMKWLMGVKFEATKQAVKQLAPQLCYSGSSSVHFAAVSQTVDNESGLTRAALGILSEYLDEKWFKKLCTAVGEPDYQPTASSSLLAPPMNKRGHNDIEEARAFAAIGDPVSPVAVPGAKKRARVDTAAIQQKRNQTAAKGTKLITSFFKFNSPSKT